MNKRLHLLSFLLSLTTQDVRYLDFTFLVENAVAWKLLLEKKSRFFLSFFQFWSWLIPNYQPSLSYYMPAISLQDPWSQPAHLFSHTWAHRHPRLATVTVMDTVREYTKPILLSWKCLNVGCIVLLSTMQTNFMIWIWNAAQYSGQFSIN